jgi:hypothetical protein
MSRFFFTLPVLLAATAIVAGPAGAQVAGTYSGTMADGNPVSFTVGTDPDTGDLALTSASISFSDKCRDGSTFSGGFGFGFSPLPDIVNRKVTSNGGGPYLTTDLTLTFSTDGQSATGSITTISPTLTPIGPEPSKALYCRAARQVMGVTLQSGSAKFPPPAKGTVIFYGRPAS